MVNCKVEIKEIKTMGSQKEIKLEPIDLFLYHSKRGIKKKICTSFPNRVVGSDSITAFRKSNKEFHRVDIGDFSFI